MTVKARHCWDRHTSDASELFVTPEAELLAAHIGRAALGLSATSV